MPETAVLVDGATSEILGDPEEWQDDMTRKLDAKTKGLLELEVPPIRVLSPGVSRMETNKPS